MKTKAIKKCKKKTKHWKYHTIGIRNIYGFYFTERYKDYLIDKEKDLL